MRVAVNVARILISLSGTAALVLGIVFWTGRALTLMPAHMLLGLVLVLSLWFAAALAFRARVSVGLILLVLAWSLVMPVLGVLQLRLLPGSLHWTIQALHLVVGAVAMGLGHVLARRITAAHVATPVSSAAA